MKIKSRSSRHDSLESSCVSYRTGPLASPRFIPRHRSQLSVYLGVKTRKDQNGVAAVERNGSATRANVAAWNAYVNEPSRLPDGASEQGDDVEPIETSRPDTRKVEGEEPDNRHRPSYALSV